ncbi:M55 family metallopeptidase [Paenibacillus allorhizosphaerae]|uniref:D-aminopeptidase n=1 Tax=Paenibacillus allorhizosphaerae TaxID=2849866 RepID=A0ABM8VI43_9BACL|nr:M55 family metallopeptidase [Paenibacillus allorhizosphaerae]CAG7643481.1 D-aminopeptidase [Paenibacillus allorhizosphaerae]
MKIYVCVDMEGIAGIVMPSQLRQGEYHYQEGRRLLTEEVNTVVEGLLEAGATEIIVRDIHATGFNFLIDQLHPEATYFVGATKADQRFPGIDSSFDGALLIGYHAMAGTLRAVRDHTYSSRSYTAMELNGTPIGEIGIDGLLLGEYGVPVLLVTGDDKTCMEAEQELGNVATYCTKTAWGRHSALIKPPRKVKAEIKDAIRMALQNRTGCTPYTKQGSYELTVRYLSTDLADSRYCDGTESVRVDGLTIRHKGTDFTRMMARVL